MKPSKPKAAKTKPSLRKRAESLLAKQKERLQELSSTDLKKLVHELGTHQIELEMQNEDLRQTQTKLESSRRKYADLFDFSPVGYFIFDKNGLIQEINHTGAKMLGVEKRFLIAKPIQNFIESGSRTVFRSHLAEVFRIQTSQTSEITILKKGGTAFFAQLHSVFFTTGKGGPGVCRTAVIDVSERKRAEEALYRSEARFRSYFELGLIGMAISSPSKGLIEVNNEFCEMFGYEKNELLKMTWAELTYEDDLNADIDQFNMVLAGKIDGYTLDKRFVRKNGDIIDTTISVKCVRTADGSVDFFVALLQDITERKRAAMLGLGLNQINEIIHSTLNFDTIMNSVVKEAAKTLGSDTAAVSLRTGDGWIVRYVHGFSKEVLGARMNDQEERHAVLAIQTRKTVAISDAFNDERTNHDHMKKWGVRSVMVVPLIAEKEAIGVIYFNCHKEVFNFQEMDIDFATKLGASVSLAIQNSQSLEKIKIELAERIKAQEALRVQRMAALNIMEDAITARRQAEAASAELGLEVAERKRAEEALRESEAQFRRAIENAPIPVIMQSEDGEVLQISRTWTELTGYTIEDIRSFDEWTSSAVYGQGADDVRDYLKNLFRSSSSSSRIDFAIRTNTGEVRHWSFSASAPEVPSDGRRRFIVGMALDITERNRAEEALKASEAKYRLLFENMIDGFALHRIIVDDTGKPIDYVFLEANSAFEKHTGLKVGTIIGKRVTEVLPGIQNDPADWIGTYGRIALTGNDIDFEQYAEPLGKWFSVSAFSPMKDHFATIFVDITERKRAEIALKQAHAELESRAYELAAVNRELESFSYTVSHDLKAPLRIVEGFTKAVLEDYSEKLDATGRDYLMRVHSAGQRMTQLIDAMLDMARLTQGQLQERTVDLSSLAQIITHEIRKEAPERRVEFIIPKKIKVKGDQEMLHVMLENLFHNAWKFTGKHETAKIELGTANMDGKMVYFVRDDGAGFDMQYADKLFQPFKRLHTETEFRGLGIGLAIAHRIVIRHGGRMWAESAPEKGATFYFTLE